MGKASPSTAAAAPGKADSAGPSVLPTTSVVEAKPKTEETVASKKPDRFAELVAAKRTAGLPLADAEAVARQQLAEDAAAEKSAKKTKTDE